MIPATISLHTESKAEHTVFSRLRDSLDSSYTVFHSYDVILRRMKSRLVDNEIDFLIFARDRGLLVLEVKGGVIGYDGMKRQWLQNGRPLARSPYLQAKTNKYVIENFLQNKIKKNLKSLIGYAVCFPDIFSGVTKLPAEAEQKITITGRELPHLDVILPTIMQSFIDEYVCQKNSRELEAVRKALLQQFEYGTSLIDLIGQAEQKIFELTEEQYAALDTLYERKKALIKGYAGTGKTILAVKKAQELAQEGKKVLILCFNKLLGEYIKKSIDGAPGDITASTYHDFCQKKLKEAGIDIKEQPHNPKIYYKEIPDQFDKLLKKHPLQYDAIIVDEGQDFMPPYWITIEQMLTPDGHFYIFYDPYQNIYNNTLEFPITSEPLVLARNCRNTRHIAQHLAHFTERKMRLKDDAPEGVPVVEKWCATDQERRKELSRILHKLIQEEGIAKDRVVIIGNHSIDNTCLKDHHQVGNYTVEQDPQEGSPAIRYHTVWKFKGCEADAAILLDVDTNENRWRPNDFYTALSRAKFLLYVLHKDQQPDAQK